MILLWGPPGDGPLAAVGTAITSLGHRAAFVDQRQALATHVTLTVHEEVQGMVRTPDTTVDFATVTAAYIRPHDSRRIAAVVAAGEGSALWNHAIGVEDLLLSWSDIAPALVINRPSAMASNMSKPYQAAIIRSHEFDIPETLITTDRAAATFFWERHGTVVYKSVSGVRSIVSRLTRDHLQRLDDVCWCPTQFQQYIDGNDFRVHVIGDEVFACEIVSEADDYRYALRQGLSVALRPFNLAAEDAERCRSLTRDLGLTVTGLDLRRAVNGRWYCFEVNPSPGFTYYEATGTRRLDISIAQLLIGGYAGQESSATLPQSRVGHIQRGSGCGGG